MEPKHGRPSFVLVTDEYVATFGGIDLWRTASNDWLLAIDRNRFEVGSKQQMLNVLSYRCRPEVWQVFKATMAIEESMK